MIYLTWKKTKWAEPRFTLRGNPRHIICVPDGMNHYGQHIDWNTIELVKNPENDFVQKYNSATPDATTGFKLFTTPVPPENKTVGIEEYPDPQ